MYAEEHDCVLPARLSDLYPRCLDSAKIFVCPSNAGRQIRKDSVEEDSDYELSAAGRRLSDIKKTKP